MVKKATKKIQAKVKRKSHKMPGKYTNTRSSFGVRTRSGAKAYNSKQMLHSYAHNVGSGSNSPKTSPSKGRYNFRNRN